MACPLAFSPAHYPFRYYGLLCLPCLESPFRFSLQKVLDLRLREVEAG